MLSNDPVPKLYHRDVSDDVRHDVVTGHPVRYALLRRCLVDARVYTVVRGELLWNGYWKSGTVPTSCETHSGLKEPVLFHVETMEFFRRHSFSAMNPNATIVFSPLPPPIFHPSSRLFPRPMTTTRKTSPSSTTSPDELCASSAISEKRDGTKSASLYPDSSLPISLSLSI